MVRRPHLPDPISLLLADLLANGDEEGLVSAALSRWAVAPDSAGQPPRRLSQHREIRSRLNELLSLMKATPDGTVADGLTRWLKHSQARSELHASHRDRLSPRTVGAYRYGAAILTAELGDVQLGDLSESMLLEAIDNVSKGSRHNVGTSWQAALSWLGVADVMPNRKSWANEPQPLRWDPEDYDRAFAALASAYERAARRRNVASISVSLCAVLVAVLGLRIGEAVDLQCSDVRHGWIHVTGKSGERRVPLTQTASQVVDIAMASKSPGAYLFTSRKGSTHPHVRESSVSHHVRRVCDRVELPHVNTHWLRHAFASWLASHGYEMSLIARLMGHSSSRTTERYYLHVADQRQLDAANAVGRALTRGQQGFNWTRKAQ